MPPRAGQLCGSLVLESFLLLLVAPALLRVDATFSEACLAGIESVSSCPAPILGLAVNPLIRASLVHLFFLCSDQDNNATSALEDPALHVLAPVSYMATRISGLALNLEKLAGVVRTVFSEVPTSQWTIAPEEDVVAALAAGGDGSQAHPAWLLNPQITGSMVDLDALQDMSQLVANDQDLAWPDVHPYYRTISANYGGKVLMLPLDGAMLVMYARHDVLAAHGLAVPATWEDLIHVAAAVNGTDMDGDGEGDLAICFAPCLISYVLTAIWASIVQTHGMQQGLHYDVLSMEVMANTTGFAHALELYQRLYPYAVPGGAPWLAPNYTDPCIPWVPQFSDGGCAFTFGWNSQFKRNSFGGGCVPGSAFENASCAGVESPRYARGLVTTAPLPGSTVVYDRNSATLGPCTAASCPYATMVTAANGSRALVNFVPYSAIGGMAGAINKYASTPLQFFAYCFLSFFVYPSYSTFNLLDPQSEMGPFRYSQLDEGLMQAAYNTTWVKAGYEASDVASMLRTTNAALAHPNIAMDLRLASGLPYESLVAYAAIMVTVGHAPVAYAMAQLAAGLPTVIPDNAEDVAVLRQQYWVSLNFALAPPAPGVQPPMRAQSHHEQFMGNASLSGPVLFVCVVAGVAVLLGTVFVVRRQRSHHKSLWGQVLAPGAGPSTTMVVTDIESSTALWESVDAQVMDTALRLHHTIIRRLLIEHSGYETATEGDSFIVAFHSAPEALHFAVVAQTTLLAAPWDPELDTAFASRCLWATHWGSTAAEECARHHRSDSGGGPRLGDFVSDLSKAPQYFAGGLLNGKPKAVPATTTFAAAPGASTVRAALTAQFPVSEASSNSSGSSGYFQVHRGLRVRIGLHTGVHNAADVNSNAASGRTTFSGESLVLAKAVADAAHGGQILFSETSHTALWATPKRVNSMLAELRCMCWHVGMHVMEEGLPSLHLYTAFPHSLIPRVALFPPLRSLARRLPGVLDAPLDLLAVAVAAMPAASALLEWDFEEASLAISVFQACCASVANEYSGFVVQHGVGEMVGVFARCSTAVAWSLHVIDTMKRQPWSEALLSHPLCEDLSILVSTQPPARAPPHRRASKIKHRNFLKPLGGGAGGGGGGGSSRGSSPQGSREAVGKLNAGFSAVFDGFPGGGGVASSGPMPRRRSTMDSLCAGHLLLSDSSSNQAAVEFILDTLSSEDLSGTHSSPPSCSPLHPAGGGGAGGELASPFTMHLRHPMPPSAGGGGFGSGCYAGGGDTGAAPAPNTPHVRPGASKTPSASRLAPRDPAHSPPCMTEDVAVEFMDEFEPRRAGCDSYTVGGGDDLMASGDVPPPLLSGAQSGLRASASLSTTPLLLFRGPRVKAGVALGEARVEVSATVGRFTYRGRAVTLASAIAEAALSSQVLCSPEVCEQVAAEEEGSKSGHSRSSSTLALEALLCSPVGRSVRALHEKTDLHLCRFRCDTDDLMSRLGSQPDCLSNKGAEAPFSQLGSLGGLGGVGLLSSSGGGGGGGLQKSISLGAAKASLATLIARSTTRVGHSPCPAPVTPPRTPRGSALPVSVPARPGDGLR